MKACIYREDGNVLACSPKDHRLDEYEIKDGDSKSIVYNEYFELMKIFNGLNNTNDVTINK
jgi:hypothetical protein